jgi:hypothetical protein
LRSRSLRLALSAAERIFAGLTSGRGSTHSSRPAARPRFFPERAAVMRGRRRGEGKRLMAYVVAAPEHVVARDLDFCSIAIAGRQDFAQNWTGNSTNQPEQRRVFAHAAQTNLFCLQVFTVSRSCRWGPLCEVAILCNHVGLLEHPRLRPWSRIA